MIYQGGVIVHCELTLPQIGLNIRSLSSYMTLSAIVNHHLQTRDRDTQLQA